MKGAKMKKAISIIIGVIFVLIGIAIIVNGMFF